MRILAAALCVGAAMGGEAIASSIVVIGDQQDRPTPSIVSFNEPVEIRSVAAVGGAGMLQLTPSIVAAEEPPVSNELVAAIGEDEKPARRPDQPLLVLRGGISGESFPLRATVEQKPKPLSRPAQRKKERDERRAEREAALWGEPQDGNAANTQAPVSAPAVQPPAQPPQEAPPQQTTP